MAARQLTDGSKQFTHEDIGLHGYGAGKYFIDKLVVDGRTLLVETAYTDRAGRFASVAGCAREIGIELNNIREINELEADK